MYLYTLPPYDFAYFSGIPGEIAYHGWLFPWTWLLSATLSLIIVGNLFIPIFYKMRLTSVYEVGFFCVFFINYGVFSLPYNKYLHLAVLFLALWVRSSWTLSLIIVGNFFIPIFYKMRLTSVYEVGFLINYGVLSLNSLLESGLPMAVFSIGLLVKSYLCML